MIGKKKKKSITPPFETLKADLKKVLIIFFELFLLNTRFHYPNISHQQSFHGKSKQQNNFF